MDWEFARVIKKATSSDKCSSQELSRINKNQAISRRNKILYIWEKQNIILDSIPRLDYH